MSEAAGNAGGGLDAEEARLARAAASGDGDAFATLYERYARRAYNLALRLSGSEDDAADAVQEAFLKVLRRVPELGEAGELAFGSYLFTATRNATYDLIRRQQRSRPSDSIPESAVPLGSGVGGLGLDPGDPDDDPDRRTLLASQREEIREANARLPERQREALALRELEEMSYDEIAAVMEMNRNSVAQLISRARISLRDELRHTMLASITAVSADCERALPLIAMRDDGQLAPDSDDAAWLGGHLGGCETCGLAAEAMAEAGVSYRLWVPVAVAPALFHETMARAAELSGSDWSGVAERRLASPADPAGLPGLPRAYRRAGGVGTRTGRRGRRAALVAALALLLLGGGVAVVSAVGGGDSAMPPSEPAAAEVDSAEPAPAEEKPARDKPKKKTKESEEQAGASVAPVTEEEAAPEAPVSEPVATPAPSAGPTGKESNTPRDQSVGDGGGGDLGGKAPVGREPRDEPQPEPTPEATPPPPAPPPPAEPPSEPEAPPEREPEAPEREPENPFVGPGAGKGPGGGRQSAG